MKFETVHHLNIPELVLLAGENSRAHGFHEDRPSVGNIVPESALQAWLGNRLMLIVDEVSEGHEEIRNGHAATETYYTDKAGGQYFHQVYTEDRKPRFKPEGLPSELADIVIRVADLCYTEGIDLEGIIREKMAYNATRPHKHGKEF